MRIGLSSSGGFPLLAGDSCLPPSKRPFESEAPKALRQVAPFGRAEGGFGLGNALQFPAVPFENRAAKSRAIFIGRGTPT
jgi:hypothetical protein